MIILFSSGEESSSEHSEKTKDEGGRSKTVASDVLVENDKNDHRRSKKQDIVRLFFKKNFSFFL